LADQIDCGLGRLIRPGGRHHSVVDASGGDGDSNGRGSADRIGND